MITVIIIGLILVVLGLLYPPIYIPGLVIFGYLVLSEMPVLTPMLASGIILIICGLIFSRTFGPLLAFVGLVLLFIADWKIGIISVGVLSVIMFVIPFAFMSMISDAGQRQS